MAKFKPLPPFGEQHKADNNHPITPPQKFIEQLREDCPYHVSHQIAEWFATQTARWCYKQRGTDIEAELQKARDEELEACCEWLAQETPEPYINALRAARRPKPKSQAEEGLGALGRFTVNAHTNASEMTRDFDTIRRALERLQEHEQQVEEQVNG